MSWTNGARVVFCNSACAEWLGRPIEQLLGARCDYCATESLGTTADAATALCPPPEVFHGRHCSCRLRGTDAAGNSVIRRGEFLPLGSSAAEFHGVLAVLSAADEPAGEESESHESPGQPGDDDLHDQLRRLNNELRARTGWNDSRARAPRCGACASRSTWP